MARGNRAHTNTLSKARTVREQNTRAEHPRMRSKRRNNDRSTQHSTRRTGGGIGRGIGGGIGGGAEKDGPNLTISDPLREVLQHPAGVRAELCRRDFYVFVKEFWPTIIEAKPIYNWHIKYLCEELEKLFKSVVNNWTREYDLIVNIPPGTTKSTVISVMFNAWVWCARNPLDRKQTGKHLKFLTGSHTESLSLEHAELTRDIILSDKYKQWFPEVEIRMDKNAKSNYKNTAGGNRIVSSVGARPTGKHAHFLIVDDPVDPEAALSDTQRDTANRWCTRTLSTRKVDKRVTVTIIVMQRLHKEDPTGYYLERKKNIKNIVLPGSIQDKKDGFKVRPKALEKFYIDGLLDPIRMPANVCAEMREELGAYGYAGQVGQDPKARDGAMFQKEWFLIQNAAPSGGTSWVRGWDLAATDMEEAKKGGDKAAWTAGAVVKYHPDTKKFYVGHVSRFRASPDKVRKNMHNIASQDEREFGEDTIIDFPQDPGQAGKDQAKHIAAHLAGFRVMYSIESGDKLTRLEPFASQVEAGNVVLVDAEYDTEIEIEDDDEQNPNAKSWITKYIDELTFIPNGFFDQADATSRAFTRVLKLKKRMEADVSRGRSIPQERNFDEGMDAGDPMSRNV